MNSGAIRSCGLLITVLLGLVSFNVVGQGNQNFSRLETLLRGINMEWDVEWAGLNAGCSTERHYKIITIGLHLRLESYTRNSCPDGETTSPAMIDIVEIDLTDIPLSQAGKLRSFGDRNEFDQYEGFYADMNKERHIDSETAICFTAQRLDKYYDKTWLTGTTCATSDGGQFLKPLGQQFTAKMTELVSEIYKYGASTVYKNPVPPGNRNLPVETIQYAGPYSEVVSMLLNHRIVRGSYAFYQPEPSLSIQPEDLKFPRIEFNSFNYADKMLMQALLMAYLAEQCARRGSNTTAEDNATTAYNFLTEAVRQCQTPSQAKTSMTLGILVDAGKILGINISAGKSQNLPQPLTSTPKATSMSNVPAVSSTQSGLSKLRNQKLSKEELERRMAAYKTTYLNSTNTKIAAAVKKGESCSDLNMSVDVSGTPLSAEISRHSLDSEVPWSEWIAIPGTDVLFRFSKRKRCITEEHPNNSVWQLIESMFDYGFFQYKNNGSTKVSLKLEYSAIDQDGSLIGGKEPAYLDAGELQEESLGHWYRGCEIITITVNNYCLINY